MKKRVFLSLLIAFVLSITVVGGATVSYGAPYSVLDLQQKLYNAGYNVGTVDGIYGKKTEAAVMAFQADNGLRVDGIVGTATLAVLNAIYGQSAGSTATTAAAATTTTPAATTTAAATTAATTSSYGNGMSTSSIVELQKMLQVAGYNVGAADGIYGVKTDAAVRAFQLSMGLKVDGIVGPATLAALSMVSGTSTYGTQTTPYAGTAATTTTVVPSVATSTGLLYNVTSYNTADIQRILLDAGYSVGSVDGIFGVRTEAAVRAFQERNGLRVDGIVGPATLNALLQL